MTRLVAGVSIFIGGLITSSSLHPASAAEVRDTLATDSRYRAVLLVDLSLTPTPNNQKCLSRHDDVVLSVLEGSKLVAFRHLCSSYGSGSVQMVRDGLDNRFLAVAYSEGRGTNATTERLKIYQIADDLVEVGDVKVGSGTGPSSRWRYDYKIAPRLDGGIGIDLRLVLDGEPDCCVPDERQKGLSFAPVTQRIDPSTEVDPAR